MSVSSSSSSSPNNNNNKKQFDYLIKLLLIGDSGVGKSSILLRFSDDSFTPNFVTTIGIDFKIRSLEIDGKKVKVQIWDTAGQEVFRTVTTAYYRGAHGIFIVYDTTTEKSFDSLSNWMKCIRENADKSVILMLLGNKCDLVAKRAIDSEKAQTFADENNMQFLETSAKNNINIDEAFTKIVTQIIQNVPLDAISEHKNTVVLLDSDAKSPSSSCC